MKPCHLSQFAGELSCIHCDAVIPARDLDTARERMRNWQERFET